MKTYLLLLLSLAVIPYLLFVVWGRLSPIIRERKIRRFVSLFQRAIQHTLHKGQEKNQEIISFYDYWYSWILAYSLYGVSYYVKNKSDSPPQLAAWGCIENSLDCFERHIIDCFEQEVRVNLCKRVQGLQDCLCDVKDDCYLGNHLWDSDKATIKKYGIKEYE